jgi:hypothetical protein
MRFHLVERIAAGTFAGITATGRPALLLTGVPGFLLAGNGVWRWP